MDITAMVKKIKTERPEIDSVLYVGCGASKAELYPGKYFLDVNAKKLRVSLITANEFNYAMPLSVGNRSVVITCSLGGNTPETVEAAKRAMTAGAYVIAITHDPDAPLAKNCHQCVIHGFEKNYAAKLEKMTYALQIAVELLQAYEGYQHYAAMQNGFAAIYDIIENAVSFTTAPAKEFAQRYKDAPIIYVMSSGASTEVAYAFSICLLMEMQWINSATFHDGEFFHGPFEIVEKDVHFVLLMNEGRTRPMDSRALDFLNRFNATTAVIDAKDFGLGGKIAPEVVDYFNPMLHSAVLRVYAEQLAILRDHPLSQRRYMWKLEY